MEKDFAEELRETMRAIEQNAEDRRTLRGKYAPPTGVCQAAIYKTFMFAKATEACGGRIIADVEARHSDKIGGPLPNHYIAGWHCEKCGVVYKFLPKED
jgi:hypothetical protein